MQEQPAQRVVFAVWHAPGAPDDADALRSMLTKGGAATVELHDTSESWMASDADALVVRGSDETGTPSPEFDTFLPRHDFEPLKGRRILGIGHEAGRAFGAIGLDIRGDGCASFHESEPALRLGDGQSVPEGRAGDRLVAFRANTLPGEKSIWDCEGLHLPKTEELATQVEAVARWAHDPDYAPITRQGNVIFCGISADIRTWTPEFCAAFRELAIALARSPDVPFRLSEWEVTAPGTYKFALATGGQPEAASGKSFFFKFSKPVLFSAGLEMSRGGQVMLFFSGQATGRAMERVDATRGETLRILMPVNQQSVTANGDSYWVLRVENFDLRIAADCSLRISHDPEAVLRFTDGLSVGMGDPPQDGATVRELIHLLSSEDGDTALRARAALLMVGEAAVPILEAAQNGAKGELWLTIAMIVSHITEMD